MRPPSVGFTVGKAMVALAVLAIAAILLTSVLSDVAWSGHTTISLESSPLLRRLKEAG
jgi:hypothetical protein